MRLKGAFGPSALLLAAASAAIGCSGMAGPEPSAQDTSFSSETASASSKPTDGGPSGIAVTGDAGAVSASGLAAVWVPY